MVEGDESIVCAPTKR